MLSQLPDAVCFAVCDVISLQPSVNNDMGVPAENNNKQTFKGEPNPKLPPKCVLEALNIILHGSTRVEMAGRCLPNPQFCDGYLAVTPVIMSTSS